MLKLFILSCIIVFIIDKSGIITSLKSGIRNYLQIKDVTLKPFDCSLCMTHWICLLYLVITNFSLELYLFVCALSFMTPLISYAYDVIYCGIERILYNIDTALKNL